MITVTTVMTHLYHYIDVMVRFSMECALSLLNLRGAISCRQLAAVLIIGQVYNNEHCKCITLHVPVHSSILAI